MRFCTSLLVTALLSLPVAAAAKPVLYECDLTKKVQKINWLSNKMMFVVDGKKVQVVDGHVLYFMDGPTTAKATKRGDKLTFRWILSGITSKSGQRMKPSQYRLILNTKTNQFTAYANSSAHSATVRGSGTCKVRTNVRLPKVFG